MSDGGYYAIKGFEFQIDKTILELFKADDTTPVCLEQIQDINTNDFVMQVKYKETQKYTPAKIKEPIIQLINEYQAFPIKKYYLYCYFNNVKEKKRNFTSSEIDRVLGNKKDDFTKPIKDGFLSNFELHFSKSFQEQFIQAVKIIKSNLNCSNFDEALVHYGSIASHLRKIVTNNLDIKNRTCTKSEILAIITGNRKTVFDSAYRIYKGKQQYIAEIKRRHFTYRNIDNWERFVIMELSGSEDVSAIKTTVLNIKKKYYKKLVRGIKSGAPYIYFINISKDNLKGLKTELIAENNIIKDGYDFMDAEFYTKSLKVKSTIKNEISIKFINNEDNLKAMLGCDLGCTKKIYQFYHTTPIELPFDIDTVNIEISELSEIQQILK
ncbi:MAG: hypothetical protein U9O95_08065 [Candidatus Marinimicrobia bacterium]|nr:hypothetical protein [Candidatus Neomarinimicrobiota bacterium]